MPEWTYKPGDWLCLCDVCGKKVHASETKKRWDGLIVCMDDWEPRQSLDFVKARADKISVPFTRPQPAEDSFTTVNYINTGDTVYCTLATRMAVADIGTADCATVGRTHFPGDL